MSDEPSTSFIPPLPGSPDLAKKSVRHHVSRFAVTLGVSILILLVIAAGAAGYAYVTLVGHATTATSGALTPIAHASDASTTTPERIISTLSITSAVPATGKFIAADLVSMKLYLYQDGVATAEYPILTKGRPGTPFETPSGFYQILTKEQNHLSTIGKVYMPYSMQFYGNYFIHGWPYYPDGTPVATSYSGGCIRLSTEDAGQVFAFADKGTKLFVYDSKQTSTPAPLVLSPHPAPDVSAQSYVVADLDTGEVYLDKNASQSWPIASVTKLMTALVANETINFEQHVPLTEGDLFYPQVPTDTKPERALVGDLFNPLLMESNNAVAHALAKYYGNTQFIAWMNSTAVSLDMHDTTYADPSGESPQNVSTVDDLFRLTRYLADKKSFIFTISRKPSYTLHTDSGDTFAIRNFNVFSDRSDFIGGKVGQTLAAGETMVSVFKEPTTLGDRRIAIIVLQSKDYTTDTKALLSWFTDSNQGAANQAACASCATPPARRIIAQ
jgi:D-alanyl-D-alanine carboxypeptidase/lipoprotein-anchoring transpeptidase ErfK/SrfK